MDALRLLGSLARGTLGRSMPGGAKAAIGLGLMGVAIAAVEHYQQQQTAARPSAPPPPPGGAGGAVPPPLPGALPPPLPAAAHQQAIVLVQAMIAAASADGVIDDDERARIHARVEGSGAGPEERAFLESQLAAPPNLDAVVAGVSSPQLAEEVYLASLLAVTLDSNAERVYIRELASRLALDQETVARLHQLAGVPAP
ncbi:MAG: tellurite resistance TerB family protein [Acidobacteriota bacterium]